VLQPGLWRVSPFPAQVIGRIPGGLQFSIPLLQRIPKGLFLVRVQEAHVGRAIQPRLLHAVDGIGLQVLQADGVAKGR
jgi:hypothetical protein